MRKQLLLFTVFLISYFGIAQKQPNLSSLKTQSQKLQSWIRYCDAVLDSGDYNRLVLVANQGIALAEKDNAYLAKFFYFRAYGNEYNNNLYDLAISDYEKSWEYSKKSKNLKDETLALMRLNYLYYSVKQFDKRDNLIKYIKVVLDTTKDIYSQAILNGSLGEYHLDKSEYEKFIGYKLKAIVYRKKFPKDDLSNSNNIGISYAQIASGYIKMKQFEKAIEYTNYANSYIRNSLDATAYLYNYYIQSYAALKESDSIKKYYTGIYKLVSKNNPLNLNISFANRIMAEYYIDEHNTDKALNFADKALFYAQKSNDEEILMEANMTKGKVLYERHDYKNAISLLLLASKDALSFDKEHFASINKTISNSYASLGHWKEAYQYYNTYSQYNDTIALETAKQGIANAEAQYQNKNKQQEIKTLSAENTIKNLQINNARKQQWFFIFGIILLGIIGLLLFNQSRNRKKTNQKLQLLNSELNQANKIKARFFSILNHDLRSPVSNLIHFLHLKKNEPELMDEETEKRLENKTTTAVENLLDTMEDLLLWSKGQMENFEPHPKNISVHSVFEDNRKHFSSVENMTIAYENPADIQLITDENYLKTIIRNLTSNAIKALEKTPNATIVWKSWEDNNHRYLSITDNGTGGTQEQFKALYDEKEVVGIKTGLGLHLIRDLAKAIDCKISVETHQNLGTTFILTLQ